METINLLSKWEMRKVRNMSKFWAFNEENGEITLKIEGEIVSNNEAWIYDWLDEDHTAPNAFIKELNSYKGKDITLWIDSPGGDVFAGAGMYNALKEHKGKITAKILRAMSIASVIAMAADNIIMSPVGIFMIHNPWSSFQGDLNGMRKMADILETIGEAMINAYTLKSGRSREEIRNIMNEETFYNAEQAVENKFADSILEQGGNIMMSYSSKTIKNTMNASLEIFKKIENKADDVAKARLKLEIEL